MNIKMLKSFFNNNYNCESELRQHFYNILKKDGVTENPNNNTPHSDQDSAINKQKDNDDND